MTHISSIHSFNSTMRSVRHSAINFLENVVIYLTLHLNDFDHDETSIKEAIAIIKSLRHDLFIIDFPEEEDL